MSAFRLFLGIPLLSTIIKSKFSYHHPNLEKTVWGLKFKNPVGLAAGFDKDGRYLDIMACLGFGFIEVGTVTPRPQPGNPKPRIFRLQKDQALINRMGFNNEGVDALVERLKKFNKGDLIIGGNIGKNKDTPLSKANEDYMISFEKLFPYVDYFVVNVSSPNTPNLRSLQDKIPLSNLLHSLSALNNKHDKAKPIILKIAPDLNTDQLKDVIEVVEATNIDGLIISNTTISRKGLLTGRGRLQKIANGGLSGKPLFTNSTKMVEDASKYTNTHLPIIGVGGIHSVDDANNKLQAGSDLIQIYTGLIYQGPFLVKQIKEHLAKKVV